MLRRLFHDVVWYRIMEQSSSGRRGGGRAARQAARTARSIESVPFLTRNLAPVEVLGEEGLSMIEANADTLLDQVGVEVIDFPEALDIFRDGGCDVTETRVRFPKGLARSLIAGATSSLTGRSPARQA